MARRPAGRRRGTYRLEERRDAVRRTTLTAALGVVVALWLIAGPADAFESASGLAPGASPWGATEILGLDDTEVARVIQHGPWPPAPARDPSNAVSGHPAAIALGHRLFFEVRLSATGTVACATCHVPARGFTDG